MFRRKLGSPMSAASRAARAEGLRFVRPARLEEGSRIGIYGAGTTGRRVLEVLRNSGVRVEFFLDQAAERLKEVAGVPVQQPFRNRVKVPGDSVPVVLAVFNRDVDTVSVGRRLARHGYGQIVSYPKFHSIYWGALGEHFWLGDPALVGRESHSIEAVGHLWADERSRKVFWALVDLYESRALQRAPRPSVREEEYLAPDVPGWPPASPIRLVDCGAYDGDTLERFRAARLPLRAAVCFEPDPENFRLLERRLAGWPAARRRGVEIWPCGVAEQAGSYRFDSGHGESSRLGESTAGTEVACVSLDEALPRFAPNFVKLDVEGAEERALRGAEGLVREHRPGLAVSVYHRPADLWQLPALIDGWSLGYRLFLRSYGFNGFDTVCYAVPGPKPRRVRPAPSPGIRPRNF
jgi:FkbM family methyltransferase